MSTFVLALTALAASVSAGETPDVQMIVQRSVAVTNTDWEAEPRYSYQERETDQHGSKTYEVTMLEGSPYYRLIAVNGEPLSSEEKQQEGQKFETERHKRRSESTKDRADRIAKYQRDRTRDHEMMQQLVNAFNFKFAGERKAMGHQVYVLDATPRPDYHPPNINAQVLTGMQGQLWVDIQTFQWVKATAHVVRPVSIEGFLARVEPGTYFELEKMPVARDIWLPRHFEMRSNSRVVFVFSHRTQENDTFSNYRMQ